MEITVTLENIEPCARYFWERVLKHDRVFAFHGEMGSGKTTFIAALCAAKGVAGHVSSPTFSLINEYTYKEDGMPKRIFHIDLYRLKDEEEAINAGIEDCLFSGDICFVEWPEKIPSLLPENRVDVYLHPVNTHTRLLKIDFHR
ncbi:MAG TPA: tRNA (adenosine(37)-N6)-threonylcarbamoyltransferase complex ATPase subunit type 1 TsaE [Agriterribacter sp.]|nr:tRNA (adenosine(37)-N6)-threonylcarbamoyltransferase complex ATPase subunit type 1 TsaE [Agriterribacter sp.]